MRTIERAGLTGIMATAGASTTAPRRSGETFTLPLPDTAGPSDVQHPVQAAKNAEEAAPGATLQTALDAFQKEARMTPAQRIRRDVLEKEKLTEDDLKAMPPEERRKVEAKIAPEIARRLKLHADQQRNRLNHGGIA